MRRTPAVMLIAFGMVVFLAWGPSAQARSQVSPHHQAVVQATQQNHADVVRYWTAGRVATARSADVVLDALGKRIPAARPGGSGGTTTKVVGASWTSGGMVLKTTGKVLFTLGSTNYVCSASVVEDQVAGRALALTAGHCVYDDVNDQFATNWMFIPEFDSAPTFSCAATIHGCWTANALVTTAQWAGSDFNHDIGFAVLGAGGKATTQVDDKVGAQAIAFNTTHPTLVYAFGYPAAGTYSGNDLVYCAGNDTKDTISLTSTTFGLACSMNGGSSGGPWSREFNPITGIGTLTSVNSYTYRGVKNRMFGPYFGPVEANAFSIAVAAGNNKIS